jgi:hypothetical protein
MKKLFLVFAIIPFLTGCNFLSDLTKIDLPLSQTVTIPKATPANIEATIKTPDVTTDIESTLSSYNVTTDLIESVSFKGMKLTSSDESSLSYLKKVEIWISADSLESKKIAWIDEVSASPGSSVTLNVSTDDLKSYVLKDKFSMMLKVTNDEQLIADKNIKVDMDFTLDLKVLGL